MAHLVESMAYVGATPWHGLGNELEEHQPLEVWAQQAGMNWQIEEAPVHFMTPPKPKMSFGDLLAYPDHKVLYRSDTLEPLSVVGQRYQVVQPEAILEFYRDLTEVAGFELDTAGVLKGGRKLWALARTGQSARIQGQDQIDGYLLLATACDGSMATTAQFTSVRVVCNNTLAVSLREGSSQKAVPCVKVPHNTRFDAEAVKKQLGVSVSGWTSFMDQLKELSYRKIKPREAEHYLTQLLITPDHPQPEKANRKAIERILELYNGKARGSHFKSSEGTAFGLLNAVTEYVDHEKRARSQDNRLDSAWFGQGATLKQKALDQAMAFVS